MCSSMLLDFLACESGAGFSVTSSPMLTYSSSIGVVAICFGVVFYNYSLATTSSVMFDF